VTSRPPKILVIKSDTSELKNVEVFVNELFTEKKIPRKYFNNVLLCISEAVINSFEHGNKNITHKKVSIFADCKAGLLTVKVMDEGEGFIIDSIPNPLLSENIKNESGRGIHIIKTLSDQIEYSNNSNCIQFKIKCK